MDTQRLHLLLPKGLADVPLGPQGLDAGDPALGSPSPQLDSCPFSGARQPLAAPDRQRRRDALPLPTSVRSPGRLGRNAVPVVMGYGQKPEQRTIVT